MDLAFSPEHEVFRAQLRAWFATALPADLSRKVLSGQKVTKPEHVAWQKTLGAQGWLAPSWPREWGGPGWDPIQRFIFDEEASRAGVPRANLPGIDLLGPVLVAFGTEEQKQRFLPPILASDHWWCQGFSEPGAGSDLAALSTRAVRDGDHYIVNGTKLWTSHAQNANWLMCLARTSIEPRKQAGISFLLVDMDQPGISVSPIITIGGVHAVNQVILEDVRVPVENCLGGEGRAWDITKFLLGAERVLGAWIGSSSELLRQVKSLISREYSGNVPQELKLRVARVEIELVALRLAAVRVLEDEMAGREAGPEVSVLKIKGSEVQQRLSELLVEACGPLAMADPLFGPADGTPIVPIDMAFQSQGYLDRRKLTIYGGAREIQHNIIAGRLLRG